MKNNPNIFIEHILDSIRLIEDYTRDLAKEDFLNKYFIQNAVTRRIKVISEYVNYLSADFMDSYHFIPSKTIADVK
jgi:uncharacterized protein with HEPN domain